MDTATLPTTSRDEAPAPPASAGPPPRPRGGARGRQRLTRLVRGPEEDPRWARPALLALLVVTAGAYLWNLTASGWANSFYSAAVQAGSTSWKALLFGSFDGGNAITVDKPPASLWVMALSVRLLGLSSFAMLLPQVLMGVGTVAAVHASVRRWFGHGGALLAGAAMALTPVAVLMFRFNNPDALLTLLMALAVWATLRSLESGSYRWIALAGAFTGLGFLTKTLQVLLVVPAVALVWLFCADTPVRRRVVGGLLSVGAFLVSAGWWVAVVELVPASMRPYIGGSQTNSFLELTFGYNGLGRLDGSEVGRVGGGGGGGGGGFSNGTGLTRMFDSSVGGQISWLIPAALVLLVGGLLLRGRAPRTDRRRAAYLVMGLWLVTTALVFSLMQGIFHEYYTVALAPPIAALVGMGAAEAWQRRHEALGALTLAAGTAAGSVWAFVLLSRTTAYGGWLRFGVLALGLAATLLFLVVGRLHRRALVVVAGMAVVAGLAGPTAYAATTLSTGHSGSIVTAGPSTGGPGGGGGMPGGGPGGTPPGGTAATNPNGGTTPFGGGTAQGGTTGGTTPGGATGGAGGPGGRGGMGGLLDATTPDADVVAALTADADQYTWVAAAVGSQNAAGLQLGTGYPVMAIGGFNGSDPSPTLAQFQQDVADGRIHWFAAGGGFRGQQGGSDVADQINTWVSENFTAVTIGGSTFYDLTQPTAAGQ
ncbi:ArnT family glycosyltransferase [Phycicoccus sonneratiae]|uniref:Glycosyltransferase family 39 protein n=1 Tax=Phycicoccus sonneratiae TaxID=2807628 RepID=A0ABS2CP19_9MICO|nr:glycosyltransferase family 39 protein [Phycicoccus sonneraticus]MBM6401580.1 glycosyltransferase family 39 protein [Phycicoccus sonneraticus]